MSEHELEQTGQTGEELGTEPGAEPGAVPDSPATGEPLPEPVPGAAPGAEPADDDDDDDENENEPGTEPGTEPPADEPATPEPGEPPGGEPQPSPAAAAGLSEHEFEKLARTFERTVEGYRAKVAAFIEASGQPLIANEMDLDFVPGYIFHPQAVPLTEEQKQFARAVMGDPIEPPFEDDPESSACVTCKGWGQVKTGSHVAGYVVARCATCQGRGFTTSRPLESLAPAPDAASNGHSEAVLSEGELSGEDAWGTPRNHPDWGKSPQYRSPNWQAELAAYKAGEPAPVV